MQDTLLNKDERGLCEVLFGVKLKKLIRQSTDE